MNLEHFLPRLAAGALKGLLVAVAVDVQKWHKSGGTFDWPTAFRAWAYGAVTGALIGIGMGDALPLPVEAM